MTITPLPVLATLFVTTIATNLMQLASVFVVITYQYHKQHKVYVHTCNIVLLIL